MRDVRCVAGNEKNEGEAEKLFGFLLTIKRPLIRVKFVIQGKERGGFFSHTDAIAKEATKRGGSSSGRLGGQRVMASDKEGTRERGLEN